MNCERRPFTGLLFRMRISVSVIPSLYQAIFVHRKLAALNSFGRSETCRKFNVTRVLNITCDGPLFIGRQNDAETAEKIGGERERDVGAVKKKSSREIVRVHFGRCRSQLRTTSRFIIR